MLHTVRLGWLARIRDSDPESGDFGIKRFAGVLSEHAPAAISEQAAISEHAARCGVAVVLDWRATTGTDIDTDALVYPVDARLAPGGVFTAVIPRVHLH